MTGERLRWALSRRTMAPLAILLILIAALPAAKAQDGALETILKSGVLRVGTTGDYIPFSIRDTAEGGFTGADIDMVRGLGAALGVKVEFVSTTWKTLLEDFRAGRFDMAAGGVSITTDRADAGDFTIPLLEDGKRPIVRCADREKFGSVDAIDQPSVRVTTNPGGTNERFARDHLSHAQLIIWADNRTIFEKIVDGTADVMVTDGTEVMQQALRHPGILCPAAVQAPFTHFEKAYLLRRDPQFKRVVDSWLRTAIADGRWQKALDGAMRRP